MFVVILFNSEAHFGNPKFKYMRNIDKEIETHFKICIQYRTWFRLIAVRTKELAQINEEL